ncbi:hypothetical protein EW026_g4147 [Hermanssonia centrifuga]|uniref:Glucose-methanol-choline oxidoreductase N-terminal domain-containing protein n=1 Tax=Hermanssonia centrifuga TaxID=98765 RepID=A0A4S4KJ91_9APHY|nr:hypothetical protein EW026_g4147 [Hermanssonia centrifuga]
MAAGAIGTPQILQLSGIGNSDVLSGLGIEPILDLPDVGQNLQDHPMAVAYYQVNSTKGWDDVTRNSTIFGEYLDEWESSRQGLFVDSPANVLAFMRLPEDAPIFEDYEDPSPDQCFAHTELIFVDGFAPFGAVAQPAIGNFITILAAVVSPLSRGTVTLGSASPYDDPLIDPAFFTSDFDTYAMVQALNDVEELMTTSLWNGYILGAFGDLANATTNAGKLAFARENSFNVNHAVGTAFMSPVGSTTGVVNPDLTVKGAQKLRIVDASVFPFIPPCHPQALVYIAAERASDLIKTQYGLSS